MERELGVRHQVFIQTDASMQLVIFRACAQKSGYNLNIIRYHISISLYVVTHFVLKTFPNPMFPFFHQRGQICIRCAPLHAGSKRRCKFEKSVQNSTLTFPAYKVRLY